MDGQIDRALAAAHAQELHDALIVGHWMQGRIGNQERAHDGDAAVALQEVAALMGYDLTPREVAL